MKLTPKPQPKAKEKSRGDTSMPPVAKVLFSTAKAPKKQVVLKGVTYTGVDSQGMAVDTEHQKRLKNSNATKSSCLVTATTDLTPQEEQELFNTGTLMAHMTWLKLYSDCEPFIKGVHSQEGVVDAVGTVDDYERVVLYRVKGTYPGQPTMVELSSPSHLYQFTGAAAKDLYRRGILR